LLREFAAKVTPTDATMAAAAMMINFFMVDIALCFGLFLAVPGLPGGEPVIDLAPPHRLSRQSGGQSGRRSDNNHLYPSPHS